MDSRRSRTKHIIAKAFISLLNEKDYDSVRIIEICEKAMLSKVTFYNNFKNKRQLLNYILLNFEEKIKKEISEFSSRRQSTKDAIYGIVKITYRNILNNQDMLQKLLLSRNASIAFLELRDFIYVEILKNVNSLQPEDKRKIPKEYFAAFYSGAIASILPMILTTSIDKGPILDESLLVKLFS